MVRSQPRQIVLQTLSRKNPSQQRAGGVAWGAGPEFKPQYCKKKKKKKERKKEKKMWHIYTMEYHSAIKKNEIMLLAGK
jgi:hypothetical protein